MPTNDDALWEALQGLTSRQDAVPADVVLAAKEALSWRDPDAALAQLADESRSATLAGVRGEHQPELLTFTAGELTIEVELTTTGRQVSLLGQLVPPQSARIRIDHPAGPTWLEADALGRFAAPGLARGHLRITCHPGDGVPVCTTWTLV
ncbi:hypothetical protein Rhe02_01850 [Rhizocola hellebori]|uniref:Uncharacterized protein n=1 Tax=Rhizocola hellebori TaxID=1392758 RepID=A0A8J3Q1L3_9ACTN|nr:hypothetical protein [Rhizocola hellebori]GIH02118.1 hypothetical protein Rhe02_01850 [Rhizocola hellebori]